MDAVDELKWVKELENAKKEMEKIKEEETVSQKMFRAIKCSKNILNESGEY